MASNLGSLYYTLGANIASFEKSLSRAEYLAKKRSRQIENVFRNLAGTIGLAFGAISFTKLIDSSITLGDRIQKLSLRLNVSTEALSQLKHAADLSGVSFETLALGLQRMSRRIGEAASGLGSKEVATALKEIGLSVQNLVTLKPEDQLEAIANAMDQMENSSQKLAVAAKIFDSEAVAFLQLGSGDNIRKMREEADKLGLTLTDLAANRMAQVRDAQTRMMAAFTGLGQTLAVSFGPAIEWVVGQLQNLVTWVGEVIESFRALENQTNLTVLRKELKAVQTEMQGVSGKIDDIKYFKGVPDPTLTKRLEVLIQKEKDVQDRIEAVENQAKTSGPATYQAIDKMASASAESLKAAAKEADNFQSVIDRLFPEDAKARQYFEELELIEKKMAEMPEQADKWMEALSRLHQEYSGIGEFADKAEKAVPKVRKSASEVAQIYKDAATNINKAFTDAFRSLLDGTSDIMSKTKDVIVSAMKDLIAQLATLAAKPIVIQIVASAAGALGVSGASQASLLKQLGLQTATSTAAGTSASGALPGLSTFLPTNPSLGPSLASQAAVYAPIVGGGLFGYTQGGIGGALTGSGGAYLGGLAGAFAGPLGTAIGGVLGGLLGGLAGGALFGGKKDEPLRVQLDTWPDESIFSGRDIMANIETPFGFTGFTDATNNLKGGALDFLNAVHDFDESIAQYLDPSQIESAAQALAESTGVILSRVTFDAVKDLPNLFRDRLITIFNGIELPTDKLVSQTTMEGLNKAATDTLNLNAAIKDFTKVLDGVDDPLGAGAQAFKNITDQVESLTAAAEDFGFDQAVIDRIYAAGDAMRSLTVQDFESDLQTQIQAIVDPVQYAIDNFDTMADALRIDAQTIGADMAIVEEYIGVKFHELMQGLASDVQAVNRTLEQVTGIQSLQEIAIRFRDAGGTAEEWLSGIWEALNEFNLGWAQNTDPRVLSYLDNWVNSWIDAMQEAEDRANDIRSAFQSIDSFLSDIQLGSDSILTPLQKLDVAQSNFADTLNRARLGDLESINLLPSVGQDLLTAGRDFYAGTQGYQDIFRYVNTALGDFLTAGNDPIVGAIQSQSDLMSVLNAELRDALLSIRRENQTTNARVDELISIMQRIELAA